MSLILDALRKADAERERGAVPSLHSQPVLPLSAESPPKARVRPNWLWIGIGVAVGLAAAATWLMIGRDAPPPSAAASNPGPAQPGPTGAPPAAPSTPVARPPLAAAAPIAGGAPAPSAPIDAQNVAEPAPWRQPEERKAPRPDANDSKPMAQSGSAPPADAPVYSREQLPPNIRAELPQFAIGGSMYSPHPPSRSLIVNGQLYREKDRLTQDLTLEEIKLKAAVFSFRGYRFEVLF
jgi:general secretion pathway protein B